MGNVSNSRHMTGSKNAASKITIVGAKCPLYAKQYLHIFRYL